MPRVSQRILRWTGYLVLAGILVAFTAEASSILVGRNFHTVIPGRIYRCAQPEPVDIQQAVARYGIKTVINLRGCCSTMEWYGDEGRATATTDAAQEDVTLSAGRLPAACEIRRLVEIMDRAAYPILIHCRRGVDRTGLTSAMAKILYENATLEVARQELSVTHAHLSIGRTVAMLRFFELYESWLAEQNATHTADQFRKFAVGEYKAGPARLSWQKVEMPEMIAGRPVGVTVRARNDSAETWQMRPGTGGGIYLKYSIADPAGVIRQQGNAGLFLRQVQRGESIDLVVAVNALPAGRYTLTADFHESPDVSFAQMGSEPLVQELVVH